MVFDNKHTPESLNFWNYSDAYDDQSDIDFSYFCRYNDLAGFVACPGVEQVALKDSCYCHSSEVFGKE